MTWLKSGTGLKLLFFPSFYRHFSSRGLLAPVLGQAIYTAVGFTAYDSSLRLILSARGSSATRRDADLCSVYAAGICAGLATTFITVPTDLVKVRAGGTIAPRGSAPWGYFLGQGEPLLFSLFLSRSSSLPFIYPCDAPSHTPQVQLQVLAARGLGGTESASACFRRLVGSGRMYTGYAATFMRDTHGTGVYFVIYDGLKRSLVASGTGDVASELLAGSFSWRDAYPCPFPC